MQNETDNQNPARVVLDEHRDRLARALIACVVVNHEQLANDAANVLAHVRATLRRGLADCAQLADLLDERTSAPSVSDTCPTVRATVGGTRLEITLADLARPVRAALRVFEAIGIGIASAKRADFSNPIGA